MDDDVSVIHEHPSVILHAFPAERLDPECVESFVNLFGDCLYLGGAFSGADNEMICDLGEALQIEDKDIFCLFIQCRSCCFERFFFTF
jgi:hypothetical protein